MFGYDLGIDLGTGSVVISAVGKGVVLDEPAYVAYDTESEKLLYAGKRAYYLQGREPNNVRVIQPIVAGAVSNYSLAQQMVNYFMNKVLKKVLFKPRVVASIPAVCTEVEKRTIISVIISAGARSVCLVESPLCAAFGSGIDPTHPGGVFVIDIGSGTSDMAVVTQGSMSQCETVRVAGDNFDDAIVRYMRAKHGLLIGYRTAEDIKINIGCAYKRATDVVMEAKGRNELSGLPKTVEITGNEICECLQPLIEEITTAAKNMFERTSPQLVTDITNGSLLLTGGSAQLYGMNTVIGEALGVDVTVPVRPNYCVAKGCEVALRKLHILDRYGYSFKTKEEVRIR
jgi:rod shape-determining protein MreB